MATFRLTLYAPLEVELDWDRSGEPPAFVRHVFALHGEDVAGGGVAPSVAALARALHFRLERIALLLRKAERRGWRLEAEGGTVQVSSGLAEAATRRALEEDGVWQLVREYAEKDGQGSIRWLA